MSDRATAKQTDFNAPDSIVFDLDGTLWDTCRACAIAWNRVIKRHQIPFREIDPGDIRRVAGRSHEACIRTVFSGLDDETLLTLTQETAEEDNRVVGEEGGELYPGVFDGVVVLSARYPLFIVSNCQKGYIETFLRWSQLGSQFRDHECWGNTGRTKSENLKSLIERNRLMSPIYVGDTEGDRVAAEDCGIPFFHAEYGFGGRMGREAGVQGFSRFSAFVADMMGRRAS